MPIVMEYPCLEVILTPTLSWTAYARHLVTQGNRLFVYTPSPSHGRCPLHALVFQESLMVPGSWPSLCVEICASSDISLPGSFGHGLVSPHLDQSLRDRLCAAVSSLFVFHVDLCSQSVNRGPDRAIYGCSSLPSHTRFWGLCRWGHDPYPGGHAARHLVSSTHACSAVLFSALLGAQLSQISEQNGAIRSLSRWTPRCFGLVIPGSSILGVL